MPTIEADLKNLMVAGLDGDAAAHRILVTPVPPSIGKRGAPSAEK